MAGKTARRFIADLGYPVHTPTSVFGKAVLDGHLYDEQWLPVAGENGWAVIGRDQRILDRENELRAYLDARVHLFLLPGEVTREQILDLLRLNLREMCSLASARRPNVYWLTRSGVEPYERRVAQRARRRHRSGRSGESRGAP